MRFSLLIYRGMLFGVDDIGLLGFLGFCCGVSIGFMINWVMILIL